MSGAVPECTMPELPLQAGWSWSRLGILGQGHPGEEMAGAHGARAALAGQRAWAGRESLGALHWGCIGGMTGLGACWEWRK